MAKLWLYRRYSVSFGLRVRWAKKSLRLGFHRWYVTHLERAISTTRKQTATVVEVQVRNAHAHHASEKGAASVFLHKREEWLTRWTSQRPNLKQTNHLEPVKKIKIRPRYTLISPSEEPVAKKSSPGSKAMHLTAPKCA